MLWVWRKRWAIWSMLRPCRSQVWRWCCRWCLAYCGSGSAGISRGLPRWLGLRIGRRKTPARCDDILAESGDSTARHLPDAALMCTEAATTEDEASRAGPMIDPPAGPWRASRGQVSSAAPLASGVLQPKVAPGVGVSAANPAPSQFPWHGGLGPGSITAQRKFSLEWAIVV